MKRLSEGTMETELKVVKIDNGMGFMNWLGSYNIQLESVIVIKKRFRRGRIIAAIDGVEESIGRSLQKRIWVEEI